MGAYLHLVNLGYVLERFDLDRLELEKPYLNKEGEIYFLIKKEDLDEKVHKNIMEEEIWEMKEIVKDKWEQSRIAGKNVGLYNGAIHWLENKFGKNMDEKYKKENGIYVQNNEQLLGGCDNLKRALRYSLIVKENGDTYFILRKVRNGEGGDLVFKNCIQLAEMSRTKNHVDWASKNCDKFREIAKDCIIHGRKEDEFYLSYKNLEEKIEESIR